MRAIFTGKNSGVFYEKLTPETMDRIARMADDMLDKAGGDPVKAAITQANKEFGMNEINNMVDHVLMMSSLLHTIQQLRKQVAELTAATEVA